MRSATENKVNGKSQKLRATAGVVTTSTPPPPPAVKERLLSWINNAASHRVYVPCV